MSAEKISVSRKLSDLEYELNCNKGKIHGAVKFGRDWAVPRDAEKPEDGRVTTGEYKNWRKK